MLESTVKVPLSSAVAVWTVHPIPAAATTAAAIPLLKDMSFSLVVRIPVAEMVEALLPTVNSDRQACLGPNGLSRVERYMCRSRARYGRGP